jgi:hypothetical protein
MLALADNPIAQSFLRCLARARHVTKPFDYWLLKGALPEADVDGILALPVATPADAVFNVVARPTMRSACFSARRRRSSLADGFKDARVISVMERATGAQLKGTRLRLEYCQDGPGFWLEPHTDIAVKKFTMLIYLSDDPGLRLAGTDIHERPPYDLGALRETSA